MNTFSLTLRVTAADLDVQDHVNNVAWVRFIQEAAVAHWQAVAPAPLQAAVGWVVRRHEIDYHRPAFLADDLMLRTWVGTPTAATWERFTEIYRLGEAKPLVSARTVWVLLDAASGRPKRIDAAIIAALSQPVGGAAIHENGQREQLG